MRYNPKTNRFESTVQEPWWRKLFKMLGLIPEDQTRFKTTDRVELHDWQKAELGEESYMMRFEKEMGK